MEKAVAAVTAPANLLKQLDSSESGLTAQQVADRRREYGENALTREHATALRVLARQFQSSLVYFLVVAAVLSFATKDVSDGAIITSILLINAVLGFSQEYRSERAVEKLALLISDKVLVRRGAAAVLVDMVDLVPGDIVILKEGDVVPADIKLIDAADAEVDESQLTGESVRVAKAVQATDATGGDTSLLFTGSTVENGELTGVIYATANDTALGKIAALSTSIRKVTQYEQSLRAFSGLLMKIVGGSLAVTVLIKIALNGGFHHITELLIFVVALAVAVVPEALPVIATLTLSRGALKLAKEKVVVKRLSSLEDLGNVTLLCTDKTGTLTEGKATITRLVSSDDDLFEAFASASIDPDSKGREGTQTAFDAAFDRYVPDDVKQQAKAYSIADEVPFHPDDRRRRVLLAKQGTDTRFLVVIGSPETLLDIAACSTKQQYIDEIAAEGRQGMRHLAIAYRQLAPSDTGDIRSLERNLSFLGFVTLSDPLREGIPATIATARQIGVAVKILTGDSVEVAAYVGRQVGLLAGDSKVCSGDDVSRMSSGDLAEIARTASVFARVSPQQKYALVEALKHHDVVGYQGDGINDAPSLKLADVGIAVDSATDVAKANADIILLDKDLSVIINAIRYGRVTFANINKYIKYTMVGNFGNFMALTVLYLLATNLPLLPRQLLLVSLLTDLPLVAIATDSVDAADLERPDKYSASAVLVRFASAGHSDRSGRTRVLRDVDRQGRRRQPDRPLPVLIVHAVDRNRLDPKPRPLLEGGGAIAPSAWSHGADRRDHAGDTLRPPGGTAVLVQCPPLGRRRSGAAGGCGIRPHLGLAEGVLLPGDREQAVGVARRCGASFVTAIAARPCRSRDLRPRGRPSVAGRDRGRQRVVPPIPGRRPDRTRSGRRQRPG